MAVKKASTRRAATRLPRAADLTASSASPCSKLVTFFQDVIVGPGQTRDSTTPQDVDCYQWLNVWVLAKHKTNMAMDNVSIELVFELPGKIGVTGLANLALSYPPNVHSTPLLANSGAPAGGYGGFVVRAPIIGRGIRVITINGGAHTYAFSVWGYET